MQLSASFIGNIVIISICVISSRIRSQLEINNTTMDYNHFYFDRNTMMEHNICYNGMYHNDMIRLL